jgi:uncharacterized protein YraI
MRRITLTFILAAALAAVPGIASAQPRAYMLDGAEIFAGPGDQFPVVARVGPGVGVRVQGCLNDYTWCDVTFGANRGWVYAGELGYPYQSSRVPILEYGPRLSLPIISFTLGNYWDRYYRARPWYRERHDWDNRWRAQPRGDWHGRGWRGNDGRGNDWRGNNGRGRDNNRNDYRPQDNNGRRDVRPNVNPRHDRDPNGQFDQRRSMQQRNGAHDQPGSAPNFDNGAGHQQ